MLKKLYKYEFVSLYRVLFPLYCALIGLSAVTKLLSLIGESNSNIIEFWKSMMTVLTIVMIIGIFVVGFVVIVVRFYQNLLTKQGYLTNTLPIKMHSHIFCKLICGIVVEFTNVIVSIISLIIMLGKIEGLKQIANVVKVLFDSLVDTTSMTNAILTTAEMTLLIVFSVATSILMFYASMAIGQQFKNKILGSVISYFCIYAVVQILNTVFLVSTTIVGFRMDETFIENASISVISQGFMIFLLAVVLIQGTIYYLITNYFLSKKLNLE